MTNLNNTSEDKYPIRDEWEEYYKFLEALRRTGVCNMYEADVYIAEIFNMSKKLAQAILVNWTSNYSTLSTKYNWKN